MNNNILHNNFKKKKMNIENLVYANSLKVEVNEDNNTLKITVKGNRSLSVINKLEYEAENGDELHRTLDLLKGIFATVQVTYK